MSSYSEANILIMKDNNIPSASEQAKIDKERIEQLRARTNEANEDKKVPCGLKNPCVFGKHNKNFKI